MISMVNEEVFKKLTKKHEKIIARQGFYTTFEVNKCLGNWSCFEFDNCTIFKIFFWFVLELVGKLQIHVGTFCFENVYSKCHLPFLDQSWFLIILWCVVLALTKPRISYKIKVEWGGVWLCVDWCMDWTIISRL